MRNKLLQALHYLNRACTHIVVQIRRAFQTPTNKNLLIKQFFSSTEHLWIRNDNNLQKSILRFFNRFSAEDLRKLFQNKKFMLLFAQGRMGCAIGIGQKSNIVLVFPELYKLLAAADPSYGYAILAHEIGHLIHSHSRKNISALDAQFEADAFTCKLGLARELEILLRQEITSEETLLRIQKLRQIDKTTEIN